MEATFLLTLLITFLASFIGYELISKIPQTLHTPLMSGSNAISGITLIAAILIYPEVGDSQLLREAFLNLLENAGKYGFSNTPIQISVEKKKRLHIHFDNKGNEIKEKHWERIFQRFYRVDKSRDRKAGGTGLGLAIVKHIIFVHQGEIKVSFSENKKTRLTIILPLVTKG